ncbi:hypothetical protein Bbelb_306730 [Branchiostoma belcheri]|nr:hypothetical protein Bbelb_306730 [Branchiostoma belcheri]
MSIIIASGVNEAQPYFQVRGWDVPLAKDYSQSGNGCTRLHGVLTFSSVINYYERCEPVRTALRKGKHLSKYEDGVVWRRGRVLDLEPRVRQHPDFTHSDRTYRERLYEAQGAIFPPINIYNIDPVRTHCLPDIYNCQTQYQGSPTVSTAVAVAPRLILGTGSCSCGNERASRRFHEQKSFCDSLG